MADNVGVKINGDNAHDSDINGRTRGSAPTSTVGTIIQWFKTMSTNEYIRNIKNNNWPAFNKRLWQNVYGSAIITLKIGCDEDFG